MLNPSAAPLGDAPSLVGCLILIPAYNPGESLPKLVAELRQLGLTRILVIDDGSSPESAANFAAVENLGVILYRLPRNSGKGAALKAGFKIALDTGAEFVITADADGQHRPVDILKLAHRAMECDEPRFLMIGARRFGKGVPLRSKLGNEVTRIIFLLISGKYLRDTQSGLRAVGHSLLEELCGIEGNRYEFEMNALLRLSREDVAFIEVPIETVYLDNNSSSHFRPVLDSMAVYSVFLRDAVLASSSFVLDILLFKAALLFGAGIVASTYAARILSGTYNFLGNKFFVFRAFSLKTLPAEAVGYFLVAAAIATASGILVEGVVKATLLPAVTAKIGVDFSLYLVSFIVRRRFLFRRQATAVAAERGADAAGERRSPAAGETRGR